MVKKLILILACSVALYANLNVKIENLIGKQAYTTHQNLINFIFANQQAYYLANGEVNYTLVSQKLQDNNLLKLKFPSTQYINITFRFTGEPKKTTFNFKRCIKIIRTLLLLYTRSQV